MEAKEKWVHFDKKFTRPADKALAAEWDKDERMAKYMLTQTPLSSVSRNSLLLLSSGMQL